jgi:ATP-dependent Lon protease
MEVIELPGYTEEEKVEIADRYLVPRQREANGLEADQIAVTPDALAFLVRHYTREAGVRNLEREIGTICRKYARHLLEKKALDPVVSARIVEELLGAPRFKVVEELESRVRRAGVAVGLAWTPVGGEVLFVEANLAGGGRNLTVTGQLGEVMQESTRAALTWVRSIAPRLGLETDFYQNRDVHVHVPSGAIPKDGPSAGVTMVTALVSAVTGHPVRPGMAMTGEITLSGHVLPVGGIKEKVLAARRAGVRDIVLPRENERNVKEDLDESLLSGISIHYVETIEEVVTLAFDDPVLDVGVEVPSPEKAGVR